MTGRGTLILAALLVASPVLAGEKETVSQAAPVARGVAGARAVGLPRNFSGQRFSPGYRGQAFPGALRSPYASMGLPNGVRVRALPARSRVDPDLAISANSNVPVARPDRRSDAADAIIATIPQNRRNGNSGAENREAGAATPALATGGAAGANGAGTTTANIPVTNSGRARRGDGRSVVPFHNDSNVSLSDANGRCRDWRRHGGDRNWWRRNCPVILLVGSGYWGWNDGWWYPAYGYSSVYSSYVYDGPIYGYDGLPPDQVVANVQGALQELGYFQYAVDGVLGPATQEAIAEYQRDNGLLVTGAIDRATLASLGFIY